jgi:hypothetical protein
MVFAARTGVQTMNEQLENQATIINKSVKDELNDQELEKAYGGCCNGKHHPSLPTSGKVFEIDDFSF